MDSLVETRGLRVHYRTKRGWVRAVDGVDLTLPQGEAFGLVGESGCGKSTLGKALLGVLPPGTRVEGEILWGMPADQRREMQRLEDRVAPRVRELLEDDPPRVLDLRVVDRTLRALRGRRGAPDGLREDLRTLRGLKQGYDLTSFPRERLRRMRGEKLVLIFQDPMSRLDPLMNVRDHFVELLRTHQDVSEKQAVRRATEALASVGIPPTRLKNYPHEFSGGMRQRIMIAMALVMKPELLVADEPTTSLDVLVESQILDLIETLKDELGMSLLLITHNLGIVAETCDRVGVMYAGKVVEVGDIEALFDEPKHPYTEGLLASVIHLETKELQSIEGAPPDLRNPPPACRFHPRCPYVMDICREEEPPYYEVPGGRAACFLHAEEHA